MSHQPSPEPGRHRLLPHEREAFARIDPACGLPPGWRAFDEADSGLWCGPGLCVARRHAAGLELIEGEDARRLLIERAFRASAEERRRADGAAAPGTPMHEAVAALALAFPERRPVEVSPTGALFARIPGALLGCDGRHSTLDWILWYEGADAIDRIFRLGLAREPDQHGGPPQPAPEPDQAVPKPDSPPTAALRIPLAWSDRQRLLRGLALTAGSALLGPILALPLLLLDAVAWLIGTAALWALSIPLARAWLRRAEERSKRPCLELEGNWLRLPLADSTRTLDLRAVQIQRRWQPPIVAAPRHGGTRPPEAQLRLRGDHLDILLVAADLPQLPGFERHTPDALLPAPAQVLELLPPDFRRLNANL